MPEIAYALAFDTANEVISIGLGRLNAAACAVEPVAAVEVAAHRASNTQLLVRVDALLREAGVERGQLACVCVGRGPGSFTGVRIAMATAKGAAQALGAALVGVSSLDVVAWHAWASGVRGRLAVVADAMRKEVYPVRYVLDDAGVHRLEADRVVKAQVAAQELVDEASSGAVADALQLTGDGLAKYAELFAPAGALLPEELWAPTGRGLLLALQDAWRTGAADPLDAQRHNPAFLLPVYTRLSDAEENERIRLAKNDPKNLATGVQDAAPRRDQRATMHDTAVLNARPDEHGITYKPLDAAHAEDVAAMESQVMGSDAWNAALVADELPRADRTWWAAYASGEGPDAGLLAVGSEGASSARGTVLVGYAGGMVIDTLLMVNNYRDREQDARSGKRTLVVRLGERAGQRLYLLSGFAAAALCLGLWGDGRTWAALLPLLYLPPHVAAWRRMIRIGRGRELNAVLGATSRNILLFGLLLTLGLLL